MNKALFLVFLFLPFFFFTYLTIKRITLSYVNKKVLDFGLIICLISSLTACVTNELINNDIVNLYLILSNVIFLFLAIFSFLFFKFKKQFMFTKIRYYIFLSLLIFFTYLFIICDNLIFSTLIWMLAGALIYIFSYFDIFKTESDYDSNKFYSIILLGDFSLILCNLLFFKYAVTSGNFSYNLSFSDLKIILSYALGNSETEYILIPLTLGVALFTRGFIFPFSCFFSFLSNASSLFYMTIYCTISPLYALILFLKTDIFESLESHFKIIFLIFIILNFISLLFEKNFKMIFGYILSAINTGFIIIYFINPKISILYLAFSYTFFTILLSILFLKNLYTFKKRLIKTKGFIQERIIISVFETFPVYIANIFDFINKCIFQNIYKLICHISDNIGYHYISYVQSRKPFSAIKGIIVIFTIFALIAIFIALFGNFGEIQI